ncbi:MAG: DUF624 domain-containing protein, partial [Clostridia bacterium]|nr:DUF624 domain-containing protein [Clostridia bacterium]
MGILGKYYDQTREGKGVSKGDARDKGIFNFFDIYTTNFWKLILLGLMWLLFSLPVVTMPAATCAFVYIIRNMVRKKGVFLWGDFVDTFTKYFWKSLPLGIADLILYGLSFIALRWYGIMGGLIIYEGVFAQPSFFYLIGFGVVFAFTAIYTMMRMYTYMQLVSFDFGYIQIIKNSFYLACLGFLRNLFVVLVRLLIVVVLYFIASIGNSVGFGIVIVITPLLVINFRGYLINYNAFAVIYKHIVGPYEEEQARLKAESGEEENEQEP